jgi:N6-L-threonylcarbamoyladenine synthase
MTVLGIETSCDETATALCRDGSILSSIVSSQIIHKKFGGVVPELASREHERLLNTLIKESLDAAGLTLKDLEGIAVTQGPGLAGTLLTGSCFAKGLAQGLEVPIVGVNHLEAHIFANFLADPTLEYPFVCLLVSGGHTQLWHVKELKKYILMGETRDDAAGEAFDKGARILGLGYPGGPEIESIAKTGDENAISFPRAFIHSDTIEFSFSGLKTSLLYKMKSEESSKSEGLSKNDIAASYQKAIIDALISKCVLAIKQTKSKSCVIAGGVAANLRLREMVARSLNDCRVLYPDLSLCTDNAAMVAFLGEKLLISGKTTPLEFPIYPNLSLA